MRGELCLLDRRRFEISDEEVSLPDTIAMTFDVEEPKQRAASEVAEAVPRKSHRATMIVAGFLILAALLGGSYLWTTRSGVREPAAVESASGLKYADLKVGDGATPRLGQSVRVHYIGWLSNGTEFNNSYKEGRTPEFNLGPALIPGWNEALQSMKVGGKRRVIIPPNLAYGAAGRPPVIPPNETLTFEIELLGVR